MATDAEMVTAIKTALATQPGGVVTVAFDGTSTTWNRKDLREELLFWEKRAARSGGLRPTTCTINLPGTRL